MVSIDTADKLAIHGGPRAIEGDPPSWPLADPQVREALEAAWADGSWGRYHGPHCGELERALASFHDVEFAALCCSGTFAVELALRALKVGPQDEVILAGYDFPGNFRAIEAIGAQPVLVDVEPESWVLDVNQIPAAISRQTRAIVVSHLHSAMVDMPTVMSIAREHGLTVVEDACQAPGAEVGDRVAGAWGDVGVLSFGGSKLLTAGRGGAILTRHADVHQRAKIFCDRGNHAFPLSELQAAVLLPQFSTLVERNRQRRASVARLLRHTAGLPGLGPGISRMADVAPSFYKLSWLYRGEELGGCPLDQFLAALQAEGVPVDSGFRGFVRRSERRCRKIGQLPHSERASENTILLHHPILLESAARVDALARAFAKVTSAFAGPGGG